MTANQQSNSLCEVFVTDKSWEEVQQQKEAFQECCSMVERNWEAMESEKSDPQFKSYYFPSQVDSRAGCRPIPRRQAQSSGVSKKVRWVDEEDDQDSVVPMEIDWVDDGSEEVEPVVCVKSPWFEFEGKKVRLRKREKQVVSCCKRRRLGLGMYASLDSDGSVVGTKSLVGDGSASFIPFTASVLPSPGDLDVRDREGGGDSAETGGGTGSGEDEDGGEEVDNGVVDGGGEDGDDGGGDPRQHQKRHADPARHAKGMADPRRHQSANEELPLAADVPKPRTKSDSSGKPGEDQRRGAGQHLGNRKA